MSLDMYFIIFNHNLRAKIGIDSFLAPQDSLVTVFVTLQINGSMVSDGGVPPNTFIKSILVVSGQLERKTSNV